MKIPLSPAESFLAGIKPSCYENLSRLKPDVLEKLEKFPRFSLYPGYDIFFRDEESRDSFAAAIENLPRDGADFNRILGETLGYPPLAVDFFAKKVSGEISREEFTARKVSVHHAGVSCIGDVRDIVDNIRWLWSRYPCDGISRVQTYYDDDLQVYAIPYGDHAQLHNIAEKLAHSLRAPSA